MRTICLYFEIHQIIHLKRYRFFDIGTNHYYYDDYANEYSINEVAERSYIFPFYGIHFLFTFVAQVLVKVRISANSINCICHSVNIRFVMAGSGDMMNQMIRLVAERGIADRFHFPGFMKGSQVYEMLKASDVYIMPSVSEPFGISPLEAMQCSVPTKIGRAHV